MTTAIRSGIPTTYRETRFRSRLEARWAAFFDLIGWSWTYEPFDADGWIPDFLIRGEAPTLIEVGPCSLLSDYSAKAQKALEAFPPDLKTCELPAGYCGQDEGHQHGVPPAWVTLVLGIGPEI